ncbi:MAG: membrane protein insertion efficiency factor YidD [Oscillospiraceae bacterium]|nr:membrane protein insertion efficiency factor YidD [Oscillospiraceae bacterium]
MKYVFIFVVRLYQKYISPLKPARTCKYYPTCSSYAVTALERYGAVRGGFMAVLRLLRCNPWSMGGIDYVPERESFGS